MTLLHGSKKDEGEEEDIIIDYGAVHNVHLVVFKA